MLSISICICAFFSPISVSAASKDKTPPKISNVKVTNIDANGYTVSCKVSDNSGQVKKVMFAAWTSKNGQDDLVWKEGKIKNGVATCTIKISEHGWQTQGYVTHVYAYDDANNVSGNSSLAKQNVPAPDFSKALSKWKNNSYWASSYKCKAWQCHGWACSVGDLLSGKDPYTWKTTKSLSNLKAGSIVRFTRPHSIIIMSTEGEYVTYADCNWTGKNIVTYFQTIKKSKLTSKFGSLDKVYIYPN